LTLLTVLLFFWSESEPSSIRSELLSLKLRLLRLLSVPDEVIDDVLVTVEYEDELAVVPELKVEVAVEEDFKPILNAAMLANLDGPSASKRLGIYTESKLKG
jgi:hypothetical protein